MSDSEISDFDGFTLTESECARIDAAVENAYNSPAAANAPDPQRVKNTAESQTGGPAITIDIDSDTTDYGRGVWDDDSIQAIATSEPRDSEPSPYAKFKRKKNVLTVSELVGPVWCELQFDYGLRQKRSRKLEERPDSFISGQGREIAVNKKTAVTNDKVQKNGQYVHKQLEREIMPEQVPVQVTSEEERWALRLVNMLACIETLMTSGFCREMPVFGICHDQVVVGIIDELVRKSKPDDLVPNGKRRQTPRSPSSSKKARRTPEPGISQSQITSFFQPSSDSVSQPREHDGRQLKSPSALTGGVIGSPTHRLYLSDTKTRRSASLPSHEDTLPARLQLMLYHRLLSRLISLSDPFDFSALWERLRLDSAMLFSNRFIQHAGLTGTEHQDEINCLDRLTKPWMEAAKMMDVDSIIKKLTLVYRTQPIRTGRPINDKGKHKQLNDPREAVASQEVHELALAVQASLEDASSNDNKMLARAIEESLKDESGRVIGNVDKSRTTGASPSRQNPELSWIVQNSAWPKSIAVDNAVMPRHDSQSIGGTTRKDPDESHDEDYIKVSSSRILGTKEFTVDDSLLDQQLARVLDWWHGRRPPKGVDIENSNRCFSCEYCEGCEWREERAMDARRKSQRQDDASGSGSN